MSPKSIQITKRDGKREALDLDKLHKVVFHACADIAGVSPSQVEIKSHIQFYDGIESADIQETLIKSAADLITEDNIIIPAVLSKRMVEILALDAPSSYQIFPISISEIQR